MLFVGQIIPVINTARSKLDEMIIGKLLTVDHHRRRLCFDARAPYALACRRTASSYRIIRQVLPDLLPPKSLSIQLRCPNHFVLHTKWTCPSGQPVLYGQHAIYQNVEYIYIISKDLYFILKLIGVMGVCVLLHERILRCCEENRN